jgi:RNA polymerase-binding transcription factor DksA
MPTRNTRKIVDVLKAELTAARAEAAEHEEEIAAAPESEQGEGSSGYETWFANVNLQSHLERQVEEIEAALRRAEEGRYGICESCERPIGKERMEVLPFATMCIDCASKAG